MRTILSLLLLLTTVTAAYSQPDNRIAKTPKVTYDWRPGFVITTELTGATGIGVTDVPYSKYYYGLTALAGYQFTRNIKAGAGLGVQFHNEGTLFPLFADVRFNMNAQEIVPFVSATGGLGVNLENLRDQTYVFVNPSVGIRWVAANRTGVVLSGGVMMMSGQFTRNTFITLKLGLELKTR